MSKVGGLPKLDHEEEEDVEAGEDGEPVECQPREPRESEERKNDLQRGINKGGRRWRKI